MKQLSLLDPPAQTIEDRANNDSEPIYRVDYDNLEHLTIRVKGICPNWQATCSCSDGVDRSFDFRKLIEVESKPSYLTISLPQTDRILGDKNRPLESNLVNGNAILGDNPESRLASYLFENKTILGDKNRPLESAIKIDKLREEKCRLLSQKIAPDNCWLETGRATKTFIQCWYRSTEPIFDGKKSKYIGREDSPAAKEARAAIARRNRLRAIARELRLLEAKNENDICMVGTPVRRSRKRNNFRALQRG